MESPPVPARIGPYDVERFLYRGAIGAVYLARRKGGEGPVVVARSSGGSGLPAAEHEETGARTLRAARAAVGFSHPAAARVVDYGEDGDGPYVVYERPSGQGLGSLADAAVAIPARRVLDIGRQAAAVLGAAHRAGLAHGDVRPAHLFVDGSGHATLIGFGLTPEGTATPLREETPAASCDFTAPERIAGHSPDARSDLFSLAATLYTLLTGRTPFGGESASSVLYRIVNDPPRPLRATAPDLPPALDAFFARALAKEPSARFPDAASFSAALEDLAALPLENGPLPAAPLEERPETLGAVPPPPEPDERGHRAALRRLPRGVAVFAGLVLAFALSLALWWAPAWLGIDPFAARRRGVEDRLERLLGPIGRAIRWTEPERRMRVMTEPAGLRLAVEGSARLVGKDEVAFVPGGAGSFTVRVADRCYEGAAEFDARQTVDAVRIDASSRTTTLEVTSVPGGAQVTLDGTPQAGTTPLRLTLPLCREHELLLAADGRTPRRVALSPEGTPEDWHAALHGVALDPVPKGRIAVPRAPAGFAVQVYSRREGGLVRIGRAGELLTLDPGRVRLALHDPALLYDEEIEVEVTAGEQVQLPVDYPAVGRLAVRVVPPGGPILVRRGGGPEIEIGATAVAPRALVVGRYTVILVHPGTGARVTRSVEIRDGRTSEVRVGSNEW